MARLLPGAGAGVRSLFVHALSLSLLRFFKHAEKIFKIVSV